MSAVTMHQAGSGTPVVLLHGLGADWQSWKPILPALEARHHVIAVDLPGHGAAPRLGRRRPTVGALADAVESELDALGVERPHVVGNSLGGRVGIELAVRGRARTLVALCPSGFELPPERAWVFWTDQALRLRAKTLMPLRRQLGSNALTRVLSVGGIHARPWKVAPGQAAHEVATFARTPAYQSTLFWAAMADVPTGLRTISCRTRIAYGTADILLGPLTSPRYAQLIPDAELVTLAGCGHAPMADAPDVVARTILDVTRDDHAARTEPRRPRAVA